MTEHLKRRGNTYYVRRRVPVALRALMGRDEIVRTLSTSDYREANRRKHAVLAEIDDSFLRAAALAGDHPASPSWVQNIARELRLAVGRGELDQQLASELMHDHIEQHLTAAGIDYGDTSDIHTSTLRAASGMVSRPDDLPLSEAIKTYLKEKDGRVVASTLHSKQRDLEALSTWLRADLPLRDITRQHAGAYVSHLSGRGVSPKTNIDTIAILSAFWNWALRKGLYDAANPWAGHAADLKGSRRGSSKARRRPWTQEELESFILTLPAEDMRRQAVLMALYSGMRLNEVCHMEVTDVNLEDGFMALPEGKTESSVRQVPIHPTIKPLIKRLTEETTDGFLLSGLVPGGRDKKRGHSLSKRIGRYLRVNCKITDTGVVYHTLRNTLINAAENAGIPESTVKLIVGHARQSMTFGVYSKGVALPVLQQAIEKVSFGSLDAAIQSG